MAETHQSSDLRFILHISVVSFLSYVGFAFLNPSFPLALQTVGFSQSQVGLIASLGGAALVCASLVGALALKGRDWPGGLVLTLAIGVVGHVVFALVTYFSAKGVIENGAGFFGLALSRGMVGFGFALTQIVILGALASRAADRGYSGITAANALGIVLGPALGGIVASWQLLLPIYIVFTFSLGALLLSLPWLSASCPAQASLDEPATDRSMRNVLIPATMALLIMTFLASMQLVVPLAFRETLSLPADLSARLAGYGLFWGGLGLILSNIALMLRPQLAPAQVFLVATLIAAAGFIALAQATSFQGFCAALFVIGLGIGPAIPAYTRIAADRHGKDASAMIVLAQSLGLMIGPYFGIVLFERGVLFEVNAALLVLSNLLLIGIWMKR